MSGLGGDDVYDLWANGATIVEAAKGGNDTVYVRYWGGITLPENVENVVLASAGATWATGNQLDNLIIAGTVGAKLNGGAGNDVLVGGAGADTFTVQAGNGSDVIQNFQSGWDMIDLKGYGITSFDQLKARAVQSGSDVTFSLGSEKLVLTGIKLASLQATDFNLPMGTVASNAGDLSLSAWKAKNYNGWFVHTNAWGSFALKEGTDFSLTGTFNPKDPTAGTTFQWSYAQAASTTSPILAYPEVAFGHSPLDVATSNPNDTAKVFPIKVSDMVRLEADYSVAYEGNLAGFNVAYDIWLSRDPTAIGKNQVSNEIMIWVHKGGFDAFGKVVGAFQWGDATATIYHDGTYTALVFDRDIPAGKIDIADVVDKLVSLGIVSKDEYLRSVEFGSEVTGGQGRLTINNLDLTVETRGADGASVVKTVSGTGTTVENVAAAPSKGETLAGALFADLKANAGDPVVDANGRTVGSNSVTQQADGSVTINHLDLTGFATGSTVIKAFGSSVQIQQYDEGGRFLGAEQRDFGNDGALSVSQFASDWSVTGSSITRTLGTNLVETQHFDGKYALLSSDQVYTETNGGVTTRHYDASWNFTGADTVYTKGATVSTYHYDANWVSTGRDTSVTNAAGDTVKLSHYNAAGALTGAEQVRYYADKTTYSDYDAQNQLTGGRTVYQQANGTERTVFTDGKYNPLKESYQGTAGNDSWTGSSRATDWHGGYGSDTIKGGSGVDRFFFDTAIGKDVDAITNFASNVDKIVLDRDIFSSLAKAGALDAASFALGKVAQDANDHILWDAASRSLYYDADGAGGAAAVLFATVKTTGTLSASDFQIV